jgi:hypothetical protein
VKLAPETGSSASPQSGNKLPGQRRETLRVSLIELGLVLLASYLFLFFAMTRRPGMYDEGIVLTAAMRIAAGQLPHRDFYFIYGPAQVYILAGLFKAFSTSLLVERLFDLFIKAVVVTTVYSIVLHYCRRSVAVFISVVTVLWIFSLSEFGLATTPVSLLNLAGSALILPIFAEDISTRRMFAAGAVSGAALLFRYDTGIALLGIHICVVSIAVYLRSKGIASGLRRFASIFWPYLVGFAVLAVPPAIYYFSVASFAPLFHDIILYPSKYYGRDRNLPFPRIYGLENLGVYLPIAITAVSLYALVECRFGARRNGTRLVEDIPHDRQWNGYLVTFGLLLVAMYLKGLVRVSPIHMYLAIIPSLLLIAVLFQHQSAFSWPVRTLINCFMFLSLVAAIWSSRREIGIQKAEHSPPETQQAWCKIANPLTEGYCFLPEDDRIHAIEFIRSNTQPDQPLYSGVTHHDRIFANDDLIYFGTQRLPATRWSHFDPDLQNRYDIQKQMVQELERNPPPYIVLDSEFDSVREPNDSAKSSGVTLLDEYIEHHYEPSETFGFMSIWQRDSP